MGLLFGYYTQGDVALFLVIALRILVLLSLLFGLSLALRRFTERPLLLVRRYAFPIAAIYFALQITTEMNQAARASIHEGNKLESRIDSLKR